MTFRGFIVKPASACGESILVHQHPPGSQVHQGCSRKTLWGVFDGTFTLPPPPLVHYCIGPTPMRSNYQSAPPPHNLFFFRRTPVLRIGIIVFSLFFVFKPQQPTRSHLMEGYPPNCSFEKDLHFQENIKKKQPTPTIPTKIKGFAFKDLHSFFHLEQPSLANCYSYSVPIWYIDSSDHVTHEGMFMILTFNLDTTLCGAIFRTNLPLEVFLTFRRHPCLWMKKMREFEVQKGANSCIC